MNNYTRTLALSFFMLLLVTGFIFVLALDSYTRQGELEGMIYQANGRITDLEQQRTK